MKRNSIDVRRRLLDLCKVIERNGGPVEVEQARAYARIIEGANNEHLRGTGYEPDRSTGAHVAGARSVSA